MPDIEPKQDAPETTQRPVCDNCGSDQIHGTCFEVAWDYDLQRWIPFADLENIQCEECGQLNEVEWVDDVVSNEPYRSDEDNLLFEKGDNMEFADEGETLTSKAD